MRVSFFATLRKIVGQKHVEVSVPESCSLRAVVDAVVAAYPDLAAEVLDDDGQLNRYVHVFVDGRSSKYLVDGLDTIVDTHHTIEFIPAVAGG
ncbi:MAG: ubiquitin-like small modifier protein 1 [Myxococcota bacterium]